MISRQTIKQIIEVLDDWRNTDQQDIYSLLQRLSNEGEVKGNKSFTDSMNEIRRAWKLHMDDEMRRAWKLHMDDEE
jgi:hypothetical protein